MNYQNYNNFSIEDARELYHHGIKGQRWGVRRYQNEDGSLTTAGRKRYGQGNEQEIANKVHAYSKHFNENTKRQEANDEKWNQVKQMRKEAGLNPFSEKYKKYSKAYDEWSEEQDKIDEDFNKVKEEYKDTGKNFIDRVKNNFKYDEDLTAEQKEAIVKGLKVTTALAAGALATYGAYKVSEVIKDKAVETESRARWNSINDIYGGYKIDSIGVFAGEDGLHRGVLSSKRGGKEFEYTSKKGQSVADFNNELNKHATAYNNFIDNNKADAINRAFDEARKNNSNAVKAVKTLRKYSKNK